MKVVFLITNLDYSGGPKMMAWVANQFSRAGNEVYFLAVYSDEIGQPLEENINFISLHLTRSSSRIVRNTTEMLHVLYLTKKKINQINPDLIIGFLYSVDYYYTLFNVFSKRKILLSQRLDPYSEKGISAKAKQKILGLADGLVFQTNGAREFYNSKVISKSIVIPNPVTKKTLQYADRVKNFEDRNNVIVLPARLDILQKRQDIMLDAFEIVAKKHPEMKLILLGNGPDKVKLDKIIAEKGLENCTSIHPAVPTAEEFTYNCKIVCLTSDFEGMPNSIIEAMALGLNVVATDCSPGGARMLIRDGQNGFLVNKGDYLALADRICFLLENVSKADKLANEAKKIAVDCSESKIAKLWIGYVAKIVEES